MAWCLLKPRDNSILTMGLSYDPTKDQATILEIVSVVKCGLVLTKVVPVLY